jgi:hypothetical protein
MFSAEMGFHELQRLFKKWHCKMPLFLDSLIRHGEAAHPVERFGMFGSELGFAELECFLGHRHGLVA